MNIRRAGNLDPFKDQIIESQSELAAPAELTLTLGRDVFLTIGTDSLIVLDEAVSRKRNSSYCGLIPSRKSIPTRAIPFYHILWAELANSDLVIKHAKPVSKHVVRAASITYALDKAQRAEAEIWIERLLYQSYGTSQRQKRIKVLVNPFGGNGNAQKRFSRDIEPIFAAARCLFDVERTQYSGHAVEIAEKLDADAYDVIASCSGDGLPHEVFNGLGKKKDASRALAKVAVVQLPCGTGNAMSLNLNGTDSPSMAALAVVKGLRTPLDLISITQGDRRTLSFLSQSFGIAAESDLGTENLRWMGAARFTYGVLARILANTVYPCDVAVQLVDGDKASIKQRHRDHMNANSNNPYTAQSQKHLFSSSSDTSSNQSQRPDDGLPPLRFGTVQDPLPPTWRMTPYPKLGIFYAGNMLYMAACTPFFAYALPSDGCIDLVTVDFDCSRIRAVKTLLAVEKGTLFDMESVQYSKVEGYRIVPRQKKGYVSVDGERVPFEPFQVEVHKGLGCVLSRHGSAFEGAG